MSLILAVVALAASAAQDHHAHGDQAQAAPAATAPRPSMISASSPADGAMLSGPPAAFEVTFAHAMTLKSVTLTGEAGATIPVTAASQAIDARSARIALPKLAPGIYRLDWVGVGGNGREMRGDLSFMVH